MVTSTAWLGYLLCAYEHGSQVLPSVHVVEASPTVAAGPAEATAHSAPIADVVLRLYAAGAPAAALVVGGAALLTLVYEGPPGIGAAAAVPVADAAQVRNADVTANVAAADVHGVAADKWGLLAAGEPAGADANSPIAGALLWLQPFRADVVRSLPYPRHARRLYY